jgi:hypothetical protein
MASILKVDTIQDQSGNNIINENANTITIGASGDTITIPSGATLSNTDPLVFPAGTVSLPAITTTGDTNTGIFFPAADTIGFAEGGAEAMRINSSGNVGIGTSSPNTKLDVAGDTTITKNDTPLYLNRTGSDGEIARFSKDGTATGSINSANIMSKIEVDAIEPQSGTTLTIGASGDTIIVPAGTVSLPAITTTGDTNTGIFFPAADTIAFTEGGAEAMRINSSGNVGIGTTTPNGILELKSSGNTNFFITAGNTSASQVVLGDPDDIDVGKIAYSHNVNAMEFVVNASERMRIDSSGAVVIGKTAQDTTTAGLELLPSGILVATRADVPLFINRLSTDGILVLLQQDNTTEGTISVSGTTVSYNGFTGTHWSRFQIILHLQF